MQSRDAIRDSYLAFGTPDFTEAEIASVTRVIRSGWVGMGAETLAFEKELASYIGAPEIVTVNSCTSALFLAFLVEGVGPGDEVVVPSLTWCATANAALYLGATPVLCDVDPRTMCATPESVAAQLSSRTRAVCVVHFGGYAVDIDALRDALPARVSIIEDGAHAFGARYSNGKRVGASGNSVCFSFYANKNLSTAEGGAIALFDSEKAERLRRLRMSGMDSTAWSRYIEPAQAFVTGLTEVGYKMNFTDLQAAIGRVQLARFEAMSTARLSLANLYRERFNSLVPKLRFQSGVFKKDHARHLLVGFFDSTITGMSRNELLLALRARNIGASIHYFPLHAMPLYRPYAHKALPATDTLAQQIMTLPISATMKTSDIDYVTQQVAVLISGAS